MKILPLYTFSQPSILFRDLGEMMTRFINIHDILISLVQILIPSLPQQMLITVIYPIV